MHGHIKFIRKDSYLIFYLQTLPETGPSKYVFSCSILTATTVIVNNISKFHVIEKVCHVINMKSR